MSEKGKESVAMSTAGDSGVLVGRHDYALDPKKRLTIPSEWRGAMGGVMYAIPDLKEKCLNLYPKAEMDVMLERLRQKALLDLALNVVRRKLGAVTQQLSFDSQGRIRICDRLLRFANLTTTVAMVGSFQMIKLYDPTVLGPEDEVNMEEIDAALTAAGICL